MRVAKYSGYHAFCYVIWHMTNMASSIAFINSTGCEFLTSTVELLIVKMFPVLTEFPPKGYG